MRRLPLLLALVGLFFLPADAARRADAGAEEDVDPIALAALLISDGYYDRAEVALADVDLTDEEIDAVRYWTLLGLARLELGRAADAVTALEQAIAAGEVEAKVHLLMARARMELQDYAGVLASLELAGEEADARAGTWLMRARAARELGDDTMALDALTQGELRFPDKRADFVLQQVFLLVDLGLFQEAHERGTALLSEGTHEPRAFVAVAEALRQAGEHQPAIYLLEDARLRFPGNQDVLVQLAGTWQKAGHPHACGVLLQEATELDPELAVESAECFRQAGAMQRALYMNSRVTDPEDKVKQRLGLLLEAGDFERALALEERLRRLGQLADDNVVYGLAYAHFMLEDYDETEVWLSGVTDPVVFDNAVRLREAITSCREAPWTCR